MPTTLQYPAKCLVCRQAMTPGTEANWVPDEKGYAYTHVGDCPDQTRKPVRPLSNRREVEHEDLFVFRTCSKCHAVWTFRRGGLIERNCPAVYTEDQERARCSGMWDREAAWA